MYLILMLGVTAFVLCLILTPLCRDLSLRLNFVDHPDADRKFHATPVPRVGGAPIVLAYTGALGLVFAFGAPHDTIYIRHHELLFWLLPAAAIIFLTGLLDDLIGLKPWQKLLGQLVGASIAVGMGTRLGTPSVLGHHGLLSSPWVSIPFSLFWLIGCTNAVNLIDGLDGLAAGVGLFATITTLLVAVFTHNTGLILATMPLAGCLLAFLCFNFNPASIFLGDSGSLTVGFMLGCFGLVWGGGTGTLFGMAAPLMALALPLMDVGLAICRRFLRSVPIFKGDRGHIHHMVLARGFKTWQTALILYGVCAIAALLAVLQSFTRMYLRGAIIALFVLLVCIGVNYLDYIELGAARRAFSRHRMLRIVRDEIYLHDLERSIVEAKSVEDCWTVVSKVCTDMKFSTLRMVLRGVYFETDGDIAVQPLDWQITLPLGTDGSYLMLSRTGHDKPPKLMISTLDRMQDALARKERPTTLLTTPGAAYRPLARSRISSPEHP